MEKIFKTKTGFCHVTEDKIVLTRNGVIGNAARVTVGNNILRILILYGVLSIGLVYFAYKSYVNGNSGMTILFALFGLYLVYGIVKSRNNSTTPVIERKNINGVTYKSGLPGLTRPRFEIKFNDNGKLKKRLILLPGTLAGGQPEAEKSRTDNERRKIIELINDT